MLPYGAVKKQPKTSRSYPPVGQLLLVACKKAGKGRTKTSRGEKPAKIWKTHSIFQAAICLARDFKWNL